MWGSRPGLIVTVVDDSAQRSTAQTLSAPEGGAHAVIGKIKGTHGHPIVDVVSDVWEAESTGFQDVQEECRTNIDRREVLQGGANGELLPRRRVGAVSNDGYVRKLLQALVYR